MSIHLRFNAGRIIGQSTLTILMAASLAGCSVLGIGSNNQAEAPLYTGSVQSSSTANLNQAMPGTLPPASNRRGPYLPAADIGAAPRTSNLVTGSIQSNAQTVQLGANQSNSFVSQPLPTLPQNLTSGSQTTMQASQNVTPLFQDNPVPQVSPVQQVMPAAASVAPVVTAMSPQPSNVVPENTYQHTIERGESLFVISRRYGVTTDSVISANNMTAPDQIYVGQKIYIPGRPDLMASRAQQTQVDPTTTASIQPVVPQAQTTRTVQTIAVTPSAPRVQTVAPVAQVVANAAPSALAQSFRWPIQGRVVVDFETSRQTGINIEAPEGAAVRAAEGGAVIYVGNGVEGYGNLVLVRHANGYVSAYAHLKDINVKKDDVVARGDAIGSVGMSGSVNRPQLHFELRQGATPVDPMPLLAG